MGDCKWIVGLCCWIGLAWFATPVHADKVQLVPIKPPPEVKTTDKRGTKTERRTYPKQGRIDRVEGKKIVVNDILRRFSASAEIYSSSHNRISRLRLEKGQWVEFRTDSEGDIVNLRVKRR